MTVIKPFSALPEPEPVVQELSSRTSVGTRKNRSSVENAESKAMKEVGYLPTNYDDSVFSNVSLEVDRILGLMKESSQNAGSSMAAIPAPPASLAPINVSDGFVEASPPENIQHEKVKAFGRKLRASPRLRKARKPLTNAERTERLQRIEQFPVERPAGRHAVTLDPQKIVVNPRFPTLKPLQHMSDLFPSLAPSIPRPPPDVDSGTRTGAITERGREAARAYYSLDGAKTDRSSNKMTRNRPERIATQRAHRSDGDRVEEVGEDGPGTPFQKMIKQRRTQSFEESPQDAGRLPNEILTEANTGRNLEVALDPRLQKVRKGASGLFVPPKGQKRDGPRDKKVKLSVGIPTEEVSDEEAEAIPPYQPHIPSGVRRSREGRGRARRRKARKAREGNEPGVYAPLWNSGNDTDIPSPIYNHLAPKQFDLRISPPRTPLTNVNTHLSLTLMSSKVITRQEELEMAQREMEQMEQKKIAEEKRRLVEERLRQIKREEEQRMSDIRPERLSLDGAAVLPAREMVPEVVFPDPLSPDKMPSPAALPPRPNLIGVPRSKEGVKKMRKNTLKIGAEDLETVRKGAEDLAKSGVSANVGGGGSHTTAGTLVKPWSSDGVETTKQAQQAQQEAFKNFAEEWSKEIEEENKHIGHVDTYHRPGGAGGKRRVTSTSGQTADGDIKNARPCPFKADVEGMEVSGKSPQPSPRESPAASRTTSPAPSGNATQKTVTKAELSKDTISPEHTFELKEVTPVAKNTEALAIAQSSEIQTVVNTSQKPVQGSQEKQNEEADLDKSETAPLPTKTSNRSSDSRGAVATATIAESAGKSAGANVTKGGDDHSETVAESPTVNAAVGADTVTRGVEGVKSQNDETRDQGPTKGGPDPPAPDAPGADEEELPDLESFDKKDVSTLAKMQARYRKKKAGEAPKVDSEANPLTKAREGTANETEVNKRSEASTGVDPTVPAADDPEDFKTELPSTPQTNTEAKGGESLTENASTIDKPVTAIRQEQPASDDDPSSSTQVDVADAKVEAPVDTAVEEEKVVTKEDISKRIEQHKASGIISLSGTGKKKTEIGAAFTSAGTLQHSKTASSNVSLTSVVEADKAKEGHSPRAPSVISGVSRRSGKTLGSAIAVPVVSGARLARQSQDSMASLSAALIGGGDEKARRAAALERHINRHRKGGGGTASDRIRRDLFDMNKKDEIEHVRKEYVSKKVKDEEVHFESELEKAVQEGKIVEEVYDDDETVVPVHLQGNRKYYTTKNISKRKQLMLDTMINEKITKIWDFMRSQEPRKEVDGFGKSTYMQLNMRIYKALVEDYDYLEALESAEEDWVNDNSEGTDPNRMHFKEFYESIFGLIDTWTSQVDIYEYLAFADVLFEAITQMKTVKGKKRRYWKETDEITCLYEDGEISLTAERDMAYLQAKLTGRDPKDFISVDRLHMSKSVLQAEKDASLTARKALERLESYEKTVTGINNVIEERKEFEKKAVVLPENMVRPTPRQTSVSLDRGTSDVARRKEMQIKQRQRMQSLLSEQRRTTLPGSDGAVETGDSASKHDDSDGGDSMADVEDDLEAAAMQVERMLERKRQSESMSRSNETGDGIADDMVEGPRTTGYSKDPRLLLGGASIGRLASNTL